MEMESTSNKVASQSYTTLHFEPNGEGSEKRWTRNALNRLTNWYEKGSRTKKYRTCNSGLCSTRSTQLDSARFVKYLKKIFTREVVILVVMMTATVMFRKS